MRNSGQHGYKFQMVNTTYDRLENNSNLTASRTYNDIDGNGSWVVSATLTTTSATSDALTLQGVTASSHCQFSATNASAATNSTSTYISAIAANSVTLTHAATAAMTYNVACGVN
jgi:hypothetical protein